MADLIPSDRSLLGRMLRLPLKAIPPGSRVRILRGPARGRTWIVGSGPNSCWLGINEVRKRKLFARKVSAGSVVYDVGAHVGSYTILSSVLVGPGGLVVAFEPLAENLEYLEAHIELNALDNVRVVHSAVSERPGSVRFHGAADRVTSRIRPDGERAVDAVSIDSFVETAGVRPPGCIKIDVEGAEAAVLRGAVRTLEEHRPVVFVATHGQEADRQCRSLLKGARYAVAAIRGHPDELVGEPL